MSWTVIVPLALTLMVSRAVWCAFYEQGFWIRLLITLIPASLTAYMFWPPILDPGPRGILWATVVALLAWRVSGPFRLTTIMHVAVSLAPALVLLFFLFKDAPSRPWQQPDTVIVSVIALWVTVFRRIPRAPGSRGPNRVHPRQEERPPNELTSDEGNRLVDAIDLLFGSTRFGSDDAPDDLAKEFAKEYGTEKLRKGERANNAHGVFAKGVLRVAPSFQSLGPPALFGDVADDELPVLARFSNVKSHHTRPTSNAEARCPMHANRAGTYRDDSKRDVRGLAIRFDPDGPQPMDMVMLDADRFVARNREDFLLLMRGFSGGRCRKLTLSLFMMAVGRTTAMALYRAWGKKIDSYCDRSYHGIHGFWWRFGHGEEIVRYRLVPEPTEPDLTEPDLTSTTARVDGPRKLVADLKQRMSPPEATPKFRLEMVMGTDLVRSRQLDPVRVWPKQQHVRTIGVVEFTEYVGNDPVLDDLGFSPHNLCPGVRPSDDAILMARRAAYATSHLRRLGPDLEPSAPPPKTRAVTTVLHSTGLIFLKRNFQPFVLKFETRRRVSERK